MMQDERDVIARKIAAVLREEASGDSEISRAIEELVSRVDALEAAAAPDPTGMNLAGHPSLEKLRIEEAVTVSKTKEKICDFEPHQRVCDHCSLCNTRGF